jgi:hypothetical protein
VGDIAFDMVGGWDSGGGGMAIDNAIDHVLVGIGVSRTVGWESG